MAVSIEARPARAKVMAVSGERATAHEHTRHHRCEGHRRDLPRCRWAVAGPGHASRRRAERSSRRGRLAGGPPPMGTQSSPALPVWRAPEGSAAVPVGGSRARPGFETTHRATSAHQAPLVWRAPEGPEGTGGLRGAAPNEVRPPSLAGGRALRRPKHPWNHKQPGPAGARQRLRLGDLAARLAQGQAAVAVDGGTHVDEARTRQERRVGAGTKLADGVQAFGGEAPSELRHEFGH